MTDSTPKPKPRWLPNAINDKNNAMTVAEVAELMQVSERHVYQMVKEHQIPHFKFGGAIRFDPFLFASWLGDLINSHQNPFKPLDLKTVYEKHRLTNLE